MMDNMAPLMFGVVAFQIALVVTMIGMAATRLYLAWLWAGAMISTSSGGSCSAALLFFPTNDLALMSQWAEGYLLIFA